VTVARDLLGREEFEREGRTLMLKDKINLVLVAGLAGAIGALGVGMVGGAGASPDPNTR
jgi:hypothetical protein